MGKTAFMIVGGGTASAAMLAPAYGVPIAFILLYLTPLPLLLTGLASNAHVAALAGVLGIVLVALALGLAAAGTYAGMHVLPAWFVVHQALQHRVGPDDDTGWQPPGMVLAYLAVIAGVVAAIIGLTSAGPDGIEASVRVLLTSVRSAAELFLPEDQAAVLVQWLAPVFIGFSAMLWQIMIVLNGLLAQSVLVRLHANRRPSPPASTIHLPEWVAYPLVGAAVVGLVAGGDVGYLARNLAIVFIVPYFFVGLARIHGWLSRRPARGLMWFILVMIIVFFFVVAAPAVAGLGMIDQWARPPRRTGSGLEERKD